MMNLISAQIAAMALVVVFQSGLEARAQIGTSELDSTRQSNLVPAPAPKRRTFKKFLRFSEMPPETVRLTPGSRLQLECAVMGKPAPSIEWLKNGEPFTEFGDESNELISADVSGFGSLTSRLLVSSAADEDEFTCIASNVFKQVTASTTVYTASDDDDFSTIRKLLFKPSKPVITKFYTEVFQNIGTDLLLPCRVFSTTKAQVFWNGGIDNIVYMNSDRMRVLPSGDLFISELRWTDMGNYTCVAKNIHGKDMITTFVYPLKSNE